MYLYDKCDEMANNAIHIANAIYPLSFINDRLSVSRISFAKACITVRWHRYREYDLSPTHSKTLDKIFRLKRSPLMQGSKQRAPRTPTVKGRSICGNWFGKTHIKTKDAARMAIRTIRDSIILVFCNAIEMATPRMNDCGRIHQTSDFT